MALIVTKLKIMSPKKGLKEDLRNGSVKFETVSTSFLKNCICCWELNSGELFITEVKCHSEYDENELPLKVDFRTAKFEKCYIPTFIEDDKKVKLNWDSIEFTIPYHILSEHYKVDQDSLLLLFEQGNITSLKRIRLSDEYL